MGAVLAVAVDITVDEFKAWLKDRDGKMVVGLARMPRDCPIARYLGRLEPAGSKRYAVHPTIIGYGDGYRDGNWVYAPAPAWVERFVRAADNLRPMTPITAATALDYLSVGYMR